MEVSSSSSVNTEMRSALVVDRFELPVFRSIELYANGYGRDYRCTCNCLRARTRFSEIEGYLN